MILVALTPEKKLSTTSEGTLDENARQQGDLLHTDPIFLYIPVPVLNIGEQSGYAILHILVSVFTSYFL